MFQFLKTLFRSNPYNPENPANPITVDESEANENGCYMSVDRALTNASFWNGINLIGNDVARIPLVLYKRQGEGKEKALDHPAFKLLRHKPNPFQTINVFKKCLQVQALLTGNGYAHIERNGEGVTAIIPLDPMNVEVARVDGDLFYVLHLPSKKPVPIPKEDMFHLKGLCLADGVEGVSVIKYGRVTLGLSLALRDYGKAFFDNSCKPSYVLEHPGILNEDAKQNILRSLRAQLGGGAKNAHKSAVLWEGMKLHEYSVNAEDAQLLEAMQFSVREVASLLGIPPHKLGDDTRTSYNSLEQENLSYLDALDPHLVNWEAECYDKLLTEDEKDSDEFIFEFNRNALVRINIQARYAAYDIGLAGKAFLQPNEVRAYENLDPLEDSELEKLNPKPPAPVLNTGNGQSKPPDGKPSEPPPANAGK